MNKQATWAVWVDGASRNNPGEAGAGVLIKKDDQVVVQEGFYLGIKTNNQAEYIALLLALFFLKRFAKPNDILRIASDSQLMVKQLKKEYRVKNSGLQELYSVARVWFDECNPEIFHVMRTDNKQADQLANKGLDEKKQLPAAFTTQMASYGISI